MRWNDIYVSAVAATLGRKESTADAVADGRYPAREREESGYLAVRVCDPDGPAVDLAVEAGNLALKRSGKDGDDVDLVVHASIAHQGLDDFAAASYVQSRTVHGRASAVEVRQASNGGMAALEVAASHLGARPHADSVLVTTSDKFLPPTWNRWRTADGLLLGDGGTALVLSRGGGVAKLLATSTIGDSTYQDIQIGDEPWCDGPGGNGWPVSTQSRVDAFLARVGPDVLPDLVQSIGRQEREAIHLALADADVAARDVAWWVFPNMGALTDWYELEELGADESKTTWEFGRRCGHLGAGDQIAGLANLLETGAAKTGDLVVFNSTGTGFSFSAAVLQVVAGPEWSISTD